MKKSSETICLDHAAVILPDQILEDHTVQMKDGQVIAITPSKKTPAVPSRLDLQGAYLAPGFIDLHVHGAKSRDAMEATLPAWRAISRYHASGGTTSLALTTVASDFPQLEKVLKLAASKPDLEGAALLGIHVEGPCLSLENSGAHEHTSLCLPQDMEWEKILPYAHSITQITLAPELAGAHPLIRALKKKNILVSAGHTNAKDWQMNAAYAAGVDHVTHLFNSMSFCSKLAPFRQAGAVEWTLAHPDVHAELIADGFHVTSTLLRLAYRAKGPNHLILVTDATAGAGLPVGRSFTVGLNQRARVHSGYALTMDGSSLAGSIIRMVDAVRVMTQQTDAPLHETIRMATLNPARRLGLENRIGSIRPGLQADLVAFDQNFRVLQTWKKGKPIFSAKGKK
ncbi:MAG: N-acetylglucosamine-6-phosphate deacetylase [Pseudomonadota bacterium]